MGVCYETHTKVDIHYHRHIFGIFSWVLPRQRENYVHDPRFSGRSRRKELMGHTLFVSLTLFCFMSI